jgi:hypothetical protein
MIANDDHEAIHAAVQGYISALGGSNPDAMAGVFHPDASISGDFGRSRQRQPVRP